MTDVRPQKGQLRDFKLAEKTDDYPVVMPEGELDIIPFLAGKVSVGASHENDQGFDLTVDKMVLDQLQQEAETYLPRLSKAEILGERVGTRAYTSDFSPFFGAVPDLRCQWIRFFWSDNWPTHRTPISSDSFRRSRTARSSRLSY